MSFQIGDKVIYPNHGLGVVEKVEVETILGTTCEFFHLRIVSNETKVKVPAANVDNVGLRRAITDEEVERLFELLSDGKIDNHQNWKGRFKDNSDKMRTGSIYDMADVLKSLTFLAKSKSLSFREKRMLDRAKALIVSEISEVMRLAPTSVEDRVTEALETCFAAKAKAAQRVQARAAAKPAPAPAPAPVPAAKPTAVAKPVAAPVAKAAPRTAPAKPVAVKPVAAKPVAVKAAAKPATKPVAVKAAAKPVAVKSKAVALKTAAKPAARAKASSRSVSKPARQARAS